MGLTSNYMTSAKWGDLQDFNSPRQKKKKLKISIMAGMANNRYLQQHRGSDENCLQAAL